MSAIEDRILAMKFDNQQFEKGIAVTLGSLQKLKGALGFPNASKGLDDVQAKASRFNLNPVTSAVDGVSSRFIALTTIAVTALTRITNQAITSGIALGKSFTINPVTDGFKQYQQQINATQTILANTAASGATLKTVTSTLNTLNDYANKTIFNFSDMATNLGTFTSAGIKLKPASNAIQGLSNVAAAAGAGTQQAAGAMYQLSQALGRGRLQAQDWNSVVAAGMASSNFKNAILETAKAMGTIKMPKDQSIKEWIKAGGSFQDAMAKGQLTSAVLIGTLNAMTGNMTNAQLAAKGYTKEQIKSIQFMAKQAQAAAVNVKTATALVDNLRQGVGSAYAQIFKTLVGDLPTATKLFTGLSGVLNGIFVDPVNNLDKLLADFITLGGRATIVKSITNVFHAFGSVIKPIKEAFREIFPAKTAFDLIVMANALDKFTSNLKVGKVQADLIKRSFAGVFAVFDIGFQILGKVLGLFFNLGHAAVDGNGGVLQITAGLGDFLVSIDNALKKGTLLNQIFSGIGKVLIIPIKLLGFFGDAVSHISTVISPTTFDNIGKAIRAVGDAIGSMFAGGSVDAALSGLQAGLLAAIFLTLKRFIGRLSTLFSGGIFGGGGLLDSVKDSFQTLTNSMKAMQQQIQAKTLLLIAAAVATLAASMYLLSKLDPKGLATGLSGMTAAMAELLTGMAVLVKIANGSSFVKLPLLALSMTLVASSLVILAGAIFLMSRLSYSDIAKGLAGVAGSFVAIAAGMALMPKGILLQSVAITALSVSLNLIALSLVTMSRLSWESIGKGLVGIAGALIVVAAAMRLMPKGMVLQAVALVAVGVALNAFALAMAGLGSMSWESIGKGLAALAGGLLILAVALNAMGGGALLGAVALTVASKGMLALAGALIILSTMSWSQIGKSLVTLAGALAVIGAAGFLLEPVIPALLGLGAALLLVGAGIALAGIGIAAFAVGLAALIALGSSVGGAITAVINPIIESIPLLLKAFAAGIVAFAGVITDNGPAFTSAMITLLNSLITAITVVIPQIGLLMKQLIQTALDVFVAANKDLVDAGLHIILNLLNGINNNIGKIVTAAVNIAVTFIRAVGKQAPRLANAGAKAIIDFINGLSKAIDDNSEDLGKAGGNLAISLATGMAKGLLGAGKAIVMSAVKNLGGAAVSGLHKIIHNPPFPSRVGISLGYSLAYGLAQGMSSNTNLASNSAEQLGQKSISAIQNALSKVPDIVNDNVDLSPVIAPVIDLTKFRNGASQMDSLINTDNITAEVSYAQASSIAQDTRASNDANATNDTTPRDINFTQINNSPKALTPIEIYRNTKSQFAQAKEALEAS